VTFIGSAINRCQALSALSAHRPPGCSKQGSQFLPFGKPVEPNFDANGVLTMDFPAVGDLPYHTHIVFKCGTNGLVRGDWRFRRETGCMLVVCHCDIRLFRADPN
jgi:hypothetical protein